MTEMGVMNCDLIVGIKDLTKSSVIFLIAFKKLKILVRIPKNIIYTIYCINFKFRLKE